MVDGSTVSVESGASPQREPDFDNIARQPGPIGLVRDRLHNRWKWVLILGATAGLVLAAAGFLIAPVKYRSVGYVQVEDRLRPLVDNTIETGKLDNFQAFVASRATLMLSDRVLESLVRAIRSGKPPEVVTAQIGRNPAAELALLATHVGEMRDSEVVGYLRDNLKANVPMRSTFIELSCDSADPKVPAVVVNLVLDFFMQIYGPNAEFDHSEQMSKIRALSTQSRSRLERFEEERAAMLRDAGVQGSDVKNAMRLVQERLASFSAEIESLRQQQRRIENRYRDRLRAEARADAETAPVPDDSVIEPTRMELEAIDPTLAPQRRELVDLQTNLDLARKKYRDGHPTLGRMAAEIERTAALLESARQNAIETWRGSAAESDTLSFGALGRRRAELEADVADLAKESGRLLELQVRVERMDRDIGIERADLSTLVERLRELDREADIIRRGRIAVVEAASERGEPETDRRFTLMVLGGLGGFGAVFCLFFVVGSIDPKAYRISQLQADQRMGRWLGVVPDMTGAASDPERRQLALNCIHRIRNKIEQRRPGPGCYAIMVASPFQGDGKTTVAMALGTSFAEAGFRTVLVDCDFIGRSLSYHLGQLSKAGVSEVLRRGDLGDEVVSIEPNLFVLPVGSDRSFGGSSVQVGMLRRIVGQLRSRFDVIIVDSGPVTASVESIPVASCCDAALLSIRRGRSRNRVPESIRELIDSGVDYLGLVLNYADEEDCRKYGSISRMSAEVAKLLASGGSDGGSAHPLHGLRSKSRVASEAADRS